MKILIIEDDQKISTFLAKGLSEAGFLIETAFDGEVGLNLLRSSAPNLVILDLMLPKLDGLSLLQTARAEGFLAPVLILSAKESPDDRVLGLQMGSDDYLIKPFSFNELLARVQVLLRRSQATHQKAKLQFEDITMDLISRNVNRGAEALDLHAKEFTLLEFFLQSPHKVLTKTQILEKVWGYDFDPQTNVVDVLVCRLRNKVDKDFKVKTIQTVRGVGYVLKKVE